jgi:hypothetical protein
MRPGSQPRLLTDGIGQQLTGVKPGLLGLPVSACVQPQLELRAVDLGVELDREVPSEAERLHAGLVTGQHRRRRGQQAAVAVELHPGAGRYQLVIHRIDHLPADLLVPHGLDVTARHHAQRLGAEADAQHGEACLNHPAQPGQFFGDPGVGIIDRADTAEHDHVIDVSRGQRGQRAVVGEQVHGQVGPACLERGADEAGRVHVVMPDDDHSPHGGPSGP